MEETAEQVQIFSTFLEGLKAEAIFDKQGEVLKSMRREDLGKKYVEEVVMKNDDHGRIIDVKLMADGSVRTYLEGAQEPIRMYADSQMVNLTAYYKRLFPLAMERFGNMSLFGKICTAIAIKYNLPVFDRWFEFLFSNFPILKDEHWSQPVKEVIRVLKPYLPLNFVYAIAMVLEYDSAYRYRFQDVIVYYNPEGKIQDEVIKLLDILFDRELKQYKSQQGVKWQRIKKFIKIALLWPPLKKKMRGMLNNMNLSEVKMSKEDVYWTNRFGLYNYRGFTQEQRLEEIKKVYG